MYYFHIYIWRSLTKMLMPDDDFVVRFCCVSRSFYVCRGHSTVANLTTFT